MTDIFGLSATAVAVAGLVIMVMALAFIIAKRYHVAGPNEALIVTGRGGKAVRNPETGLISTDLSGQKVVMGGGVFVIPFLQRMFILDLSTAGSWFRSRALCPVKV